MHSIARSSSSNSPNRFHLFSFGLAPWSAPLTQIVRAESGAVTVEYALCMLLAAAIFMGVETEIFRPMAREILKDFMGFIAPAYP